MAAGSSQDAHELGGGAEEIGEPLGAHVHASIDGRVKRIDADSIWLERSR